MKEQILTLERTDDLHSMRDKIARAQAGRLVLMWGALEEPLTRRLDLVLMARWAALAGSQLVVVSADEEVRRLARLAGIPCYPTLTASALAALSTRPIAPKGLDRFRRPPRPRRLPHRNGRRTLPTPWRVGLFLAAILSVSAMFLLLLPSARIIAVFPSRKVEESTSLDPSYCGTVSTRLAFSDRRITGGRILVPTAYATGTVTLTNISKGLLNLSPGLRVASENGVEFETLEGVVLPPGKFKDAAVRAAEPGSAANLAAGKVNRVLGPLALSLTVQNPQPISGGSEAWRNSVTASDLEALQTALSRKVWDESSASLQNLAGPDRMVVEESLRVDFDSRDTPDLPVNTAADSVGLTLHAAASLLACPADVVRSRALELIRTHLNPGESVASKTLSIRLVEDARGGIALHASALAVEIPDLQDLTLALRAQSRTRAASILRERFGASAVRGVVISPAWAPLLPLFPYQIEIVSEVK
jgi:hypothetical protein